jgi:hypothetical protein
MNTAHNVNLPDGYRLAFYETISSTNAEALRLAQEGELSGLWIQAGSQNGGKGRTGRNWQSPAGNLYASLLLRPQVPIARALQLSLLAGVAAHDAIMGLAGCANGACVPGRGNHPWSCRALIRRRTPLNRSAATAFGKPRPKSCRCCA